MPSFSNRKASQASREGLAVELSCGHYTDAAQTEWEADPLCGDMQKYLEGEF